MKKWICIILACFLFISVPVRGYAVSTPVVWGIGEEIILPFLAALLGIRSANEINSYSDLTQYNSDLYNSFLDSVSGLVGIELVQEWIFNAVNGLIQTDSIVWQKFQEFCFGQYNLRIAANEAHSIASLGTPAFNFYNESSLILNGNTARPTLSGCDAIIVYGYHEAVSNGYTFFLKRIGVRSTWANNWSYYSYDGKGVYYTAGELSSWGQTASNYTTPAFIDNISIYNAMDQTNYGKFAWAALYGDYSVGGENIGTYSDAFDSVLTTSEKDDIIDGTSVVQLYNPDALQNGLEIMPGGDPEDDPNLRKIPFAVTADWWNFLQQFGQGVNANQYVNAYNALNGLDGTSIGRISDAYDSLGIANIVGSAANAAEGIVNLTENNIYPNAQTVADSVNGTIPQILDPEAPDTGIDNESPNGLYKLPDLRDYFPFCIPFDLIHLLSILAADPVTPEFVIKLSDGNHEASTIASLEVLESVSQIVRNFELAGFCLGLILITRGIIRG